MSAVLNQVFTQRQLDDLAELFSRSLTRWSLSWLGTAVIGIDILREEGNSVGSTKDLASSLVKRLSDAGAIAEAASLLRRESRHNGYLSLGLNEILAGRPLEQDTLQALLNRYEPFFNSAEFQRMLPRVRSVVCAVAIKHKIRGSGFLIGPDLVLTNSHVLVGYLKNTASPDVIVSDGNSEDLGFIFDYQSEPPPNLVDVPPASANSAVIVKAAKDWLVYARKSRIDDGTARAQMPVTKELDYAVIRLAKSVGDRPSRMSGGPIRGWLTLPEEPCDYLEPRRVVVFQHPGGTAQQMDVGQFVQLDPSATRAWYRVSTAKGSSGGAAVSANGELFALHNAEVESPPGPPAMAPDERVNQGIRIDTIAQDLSANAPGWLPSKAPDHHPAAVWSLTDSVQSPRPIIGRRLFRENVLQMMADESNRAMIVLGNYGTFARFTIALLQRILGSQVPIARFTPNNIQTLEPQEFVRALVEQLGVAVDPQDRMPPSPQPTETLERWLALDLPKWVGRQVARHAKAQPGTFPAWVVVDITAPQNQFVLWKAGLRDLITGLVGVRDAGQTVEIPELRWIFLTTTPLPVGGSSRFEEDLREDNEIDNDFVECMQFAWRAVDKLNPVPSNFLQAMARKARADNDTRPPTERLPTRKALAAAVSSLLTFALMQ
ncbi:trypsin-like serine peptidase [Methylibium petroleiphilum]|uniref:trypsin-like serine peptidase n=1 Tax=Methylibium petroleiphilum TaxID=105560 RepID=UPI003D2730B8